MKKLISLHSLSIVSALALGLSGCAHEPAPHSIISQPSTARPALAVEDPEPTGGIYQTRPGYGYRPIFEDRRARQVGDTIIVTLNESTTASKKSSADASRATSSALTISPITGLPTLGLANASLTGTNTTKFAGAGDAAATNTFTGTITVTVIEVLSNGNMVVSGEKQIAVNQGTEFIRLAGIVNPANILSGNTVSSTQIADAKLEYKANGFVNDAQEMGWMQRAFLKVSPF
jgi:flagellar L-ring protein precursor FlgH